LPRQTGLGSVQRLDLTLFIERQHDGIFWRIQIEGHHIFQLLGKTGVVAQLEGLYPVWLQAVRPPDSLHGGRADTGDFRQTARTPMGVASAGVSRVVLPTTSSILAGRITRGLPERGASFSIPAIPCSTK